MSAKIVCPNCSHESTADVWAIGKQVQCPHCGSYFLAGTSAPAVDPKLQQALDQQKTGRRVILSGTLLAWGGLALLILLGGGYVYWKSTTQTMTTDADEVATVDASEITDWGAGDGEVVGEVTEKGEREGIEIPQQAPPGVGEEAGDRMEISLGGGVTMAFRWCPEGRFGMGTPGRRSRDERYHPVEITRGFWLAETELTQAQWLAITGRDIDDQRREKLSYPPYREAEEWRYSGLYNRVRARGDKCPVYFVSWEDCEEMVAALNAKFQSGDPVRLPTEAEWEYACRAGTATAYYYGDIADEVKMAQFGDNWTKRPHAEVASFPPNAWGLHDMHGNVWEWCADWYAGDGYGPGDEMAINPQGPEQGKAMRVLAKRFPDDPMQRAAEAFGVYSAGKGTVEELLAEDLARGLAEQPTKVLRGGSFLYPDCRSANRHREVPTHRSVSVGARLVLDIGTASKERRDEAEEPKAGGEMVVQLPKGHEMRLRWVPPGKFTMGTTDERYRAFDDPPHEVTLTRGFWMGETEVTEAQWDALFPLRGSNQNAHPKTLISHRDCESYFTKLEIQLPNGHYARLPTEAEWEYACRAGTKTPWHTGDTITPEQANIAGTGIAVVNEGEKLPSPAQTTMPVGSFPPNAWGLHDMHGNVWEWCSDRYDEHFYTSLEAGKDPLCVSAGSRGKAEGQRSVARLKGIIDDSGGLEAFVERNELPKRSMDGWEARSLASAADYVVRGGAWSFGAWGARSSFRNWGSPRTRYHHVGMRVVVYRQP